MRSFFDKNYFFVKIWFFCIFNLFFKANLCHPRGFLNILRHIIRNIATLLMSLFLIEQILNMKLSTYVENQTHFFLVNLSSRTDAMICPFFTIVAPELCPSCIPKLS